MRRGQELVEPVADPVSFSARSCSGLPPTVPGGCVDPTGPLGFDVSPGDLVLDVLVESGRPEVAPEPSRDSAIFPAFCEAASALDVAPAATFSAAFCS